MHLYKMPEKVKSETTKPIEASVLGCGIVQLGGVYMATVEDIKAACQKARWTHEAALVIASTGGTELLTLTAGTAENLKEAGFNIIAEAPTQRHEYTDGHTVKLWVCDVTKWPKPETVERFRSAPNIEPREYYEP